MASVSYHFPYNKSKDLMLLQNYLKEHGVPDIESVSSTPSSTSVNLYNPLDTMMQTMLTSLMDAYDESSIEVEGLCHNILTLPKETSNTQWTSLFSWSFPGRNSTEYTKMNIDSTIKTSNSNDTYSLRAYDTMNNNVVFSVTYSNVESCSCMHTVIIDNDQLPYNLTTLELHGKVSSSNAILNLKHVCVVTPAP